MRKPIVSPASTVSASAVFVSSRDGSIDAIEVAPFAPTGASRRSAATQSRTLGHALLPERPRRSNSPLSLVQACLSRMLPKSQPSSGLKRGREVVGRLPLEQTVGTSALLEMLGFRNIVFWPNLPN